MLWLVECACPNGHNLCGMPAEVPDGLTYAQQEERAVRLYGDMARTIAKDVATGEMPRACPYCGAPLRDWNFYVRKVRPGVTLAELERDCEAHSRSASPVERRKDVQ